MLIYRHGTTQYALSEFQLGITGIGECAPLYKESGLEKSGAGHDTDADGLES